MQIKKSGGKVFGASFTAAEKKAMDIEINRQIVEHDRQFEIDSDATVLWTLHVCFDFGKDRLRRFWEMYFKERENLRKTYLMEADDLDWLYRHKLKDIGVDIEEWHKEIDKGELP